jgi:probable HAF family extracellular repeat protein
MIKFTRRLWLATAFGHLVYWIPGCGGKPGVDPAAVPETKHEPEPGLETQTVREPEPEAVGQYVLHDLPDGVKPPSFASARNAAGSVVGQLTTARNRNHAFLWDHSSLLDLDRPEGLLSGARAINKAGDVVGEFKVNDNHDIHAFLHSGRSTRDLGTLGGLESHAFGINDEGLVAGYATDQDKRVHAVLWHREIPAPLEPIGKEFPQSQALAVNNRGEAAGSSFNDTVGHAVVWKNRKIHELGSPERSSSIATGINDPGQVVGSYEVSGKLHRHACRWTAGEFKDLHGLGGSSTATSINSAGHVVGFYTTEKGEDRACLWRGRKMHDLTGLLAGSRGLVLRYAMMIDDRGWIVGVGDRGRGNLPTAFVASPR